MWFTFVMQIWKAEYQLEDETDSTKINMMEYKASLEMYDSSKQLLKLASLMKTELSIQP